MLTPASLKSQVWAESTPRCRRLHPRRGIREPLPADRALSFRSAKDLTAFRKLLTQHREFHYQSPVHTLYVGTKGQQ